MSTLCIFPEIRPVLTYFEPGRNGELAGHIAAAQNSGVPGGLGGQPLHKGTKELETENRDITCKDNPRVPSPRPQGRDCDEYPFASSREGGTEPAGSASELFLPEFIPIADRDGATLFVDTRGGDLSGCVSPFSAEGAGEGWMWTSVTAMFAALADSLEEGTILLGVHPVVRDNSLVWER
ncbi:NucA/NucB deoxyribonuclease domain-containing protein [Nocardia canadensis]|uniref:NucA/NucB deoxyribonuclease domain-containing protein n=1 Tax=Nocardia canadensis TaxID=3065238 RepID=UPI00292F0308|nr:hypothetical protein [Nocardia canadensis]